LVCDGIFLDLIDGLGALVEQVAGSETCRVEQATSTRNISWKPAKGHQSPSKGRQLLHQLVSSLTLGRQDRCLSIRAPTDRYVEEFLCLTRLHSKRRSPHLTNNWPHRCLLAIEWYHANKSFLWRGRTLEQICQDVLEADETLLPKDQNPGWEEDGFASRVIDTTGYWTMTRRLLVSECGHIGMAPWDARRGDFLFVLLGCSVPVVFKATEGRQLLFRRGGIYVWVYGR
jgi:hypothetical protein